MFVQVLRGQVVDGEEAIKQLRRWQNELSPDAPGWLGSTAGITDDGRFIASFRFDTQESAQKNSDRPDQTQWWNEMSQYLDTPRFWDCTLVEQYKGGGSDDAGFVQAIMCRVLHPEDFREAVGSMAATPRDDVMGGVIAWHGSQFTEFVYFTSEEEARKAEKGEHQQVALEHIWPRTENIEYFDLREPWFASP
jgi:hypothetical protein